MSVISQSSALPIHPFSPFATDSHRHSFSHVPSKSPTLSLPMWIKPLPAKIGPDEVAYLDKKGALTIPTGTLRSEMLRAYIEFVHPYMPLLELHDFLSIIDSTDGSRKLSLILFQAVMFAGSAFIDMHHLRAAGYSTRKEARKDFFQKTRVGHISVLCRVRAFPLVRPSRVALLRGPARPCRNSRLVRSCMCTCIILC